MVEQGRALAVRGNHCDKLLRYLKGSNVKLGHGLEKTVYQIEGHLDAKEFKEKLLRFLGGLPLYLVLDEGKLVVCHAGIDDSMIGKPDSGAVRTFCLYGKITGNKDENGFPERIDWAAERAISDASPTIVYGHSVQENGLPYQINKTVNVDTGCCFGKKLTALVYPENQFISVDAYQEYTEYRKRD
jgi:protein phosphatase